MTPSTAMTPEALKAVILEEIATIAPDAELGGLDPAADLRQTLDLDSMDVLNLVIALSRRLAIDIPDADAGQMVTLDGGTAYLQEKIEAKTQLRP
jgi:acyl carrier protein